MVTLFRKIRSKWRAYIFKPYIVNKKICDFKLTISIRDLFGKDVYDFDRKWPELDWAKAILAQSKGDVVDVGANQGVLSLAYARMIEDGEERRVIACEPLPSNVALIEENIRLNRISSVEVIATGIGAVNGAIFLCNHSNGMRQNSVKNGISVPVQRIDDLIARPVDLIKIDIEGMEAEALLGASETIRKYRPAIDVECHLFCYKDRKEEFLSILKLIYEFGYSVKAELGYQGSIVSLGDIDSITDDYFENNVIHLLCINTSK